MPIIKKPDYTIFASEAKNGELTAFPNLLRGWGVTIDQTAGKPPMEWFNALQKRTDEWLTYLSQRGISEWDNTLDYPQNAVVQSGGNFYVSITENKSKSPDKSQSDWKPMAEALNIKIADATLKNKGLVQLSNATDSASEVMAATPKSVKAAYDLASGKYSAQDATTAQKGIVQLSSATDSTSETMAATSKAVKSIADRVSTLNVKKVNSKSPDNNGNIQLTASDVSAVPSSGGDVSYLDNAKHYAIKQGEWEGNGSFAGQLQNPRAPFVIPMTSAPTVASVYFPMIKGNIQTQGLGYQLAASFGLLTSGKAEFPSIVIHGVTDGGTGGTWVFDPNSGAFSSPGPVNDSGHRVYSPLNPQPIDLSTYATTQYVEQRVSDVLNYVNGQLNTASVSGNSWWYKDTRTGLIFQGGYMEGYNGNQSERVGLIIAVPNRLLSVSITTRNYGQGFDVTYNQQISPLDGERTSFMWHHGTKEHAMYWMAVGY